MPHFEPIHNEFLTAEHLAGTATLRVVRSARPVTSDEDFDDCWHGLLIALNRLDRAALTLLVDTRDAPGRNDAHFEERFAPIRVELTRGFARVAVVVKMQVSRLQVQRNTREDGTNVEVFNNLAAAYAWLAGGTLPPPANR